MSLTDGELETLARSGEAERVERKPSARQKNEIRDAICAFANDLPGHGKPGVVFVGVNDDGSCAKLSVTDQLLRELADLRSDGNLLPLPTLSVDRRMVIGCEVAVIVVEPSVNPPVRVRGRTMIRVGSRRGVATFEEEQRLVERSRSRVVPFDISPVREALCADLDLDFLRTTYVPAAVDRSILEQNERPLEAQLQALKILTGAGIPTVLGILVGGAEPTNHLPGAYVQFVRFSGTKVDVVIKDEKRATGTVVAQVRDVEHVLELNLETMLDLSGGVEVRYADYPMVALRELVRNAVIHRSYEGTHAPVRVVWFSDRVEITSPGGPYGKVTKENFGAPGLLDQRNPHLAEAMRYLGLAQRFGIGLELARRALADNGNPEPVFKVTDTHVMVTVRRRL